MHIQLSGHQVAAGRVQAEKEQCLQDPVLAVHVAGSAFLPSTQTPHPKVPSIQPRQQGLQHAGPLGTARIKKAAGRPRQLQPSGHALPLPLVSAGYFMTKIFHPNVAPAGDICVNVLQKDWNPDLGLRHVLVRSKTQTLIPLSTPRILDPHDTQASSPASAILIQDWCYTFHYLLLHNKSPILSHTWPAHTRLCVCVCVCVSVWVCPHRW